MTDAHMARTATLASTLSSTFDLGKEIEIGFASRNYPQYFDKLIPKAQKMFLKTYLSPDVFAKDILNWKFPIRNSYLLAAIKEDEEIITQFQPDLVIGDFRLSLLFSASKKNVKFLNITNIPWSPFAIYEVPVASHPMMKFFGVRIFDWIFHLFQPLIEKAILSGFNRLARENGRPPINTLKELYACGDEVLYLDFDGMVPTKKMPRNHHCIGPVLFSMSGSSDLDPLVLDTTKKSVLVSMGSSGNVKIVEPMVKSLLAAGLNVVVITANRFQLNLRAPALQIYDFLPYGKILHHFSLLISHGGSSSVYPALYAKIPTLMIPSNFDQFMASKIFEIAGVGIFMRPEGFDSKKFLANVESLIGDKKYQSAINSIMKSNEKCESRIQFPNLIARLLQLSNNR